MSEGISAKEQAARLLALSAAVRLLIADRWHGRPKELQEMQEAAKRAGARGAEQFNLGDKFEEFQRVMEAEFDDLFGPVEQQKDS
jgi:hypothetical protein